MTDKDNITLPRKHIDYAAHALEHFNKDAPDPLVSETIHHLCIALAAEPTKQEPVVWLSRDEARLALWKAINSREFGNPTDDKLILDHLRQQGLWIGKVTSPVPPEDEALRRDAERYRWLQDAGQKYWMEFADMTAEATEAAIDAAMEEDKT